MNYNELIQSIWISLLGMSLVFGAIIVLWIGMAVLVKFSKESHKEELSATESSRPDDLEATKRRYAAVAAVAIALKNAENSSQPKQRFPLPPTALVSAWQAVMRANIFSKRGRVR